MNVALSYPALNGEVVTEAHAAYCVDKGHAVHTVDGVEQAMCPRCGELRDAGHEINLMMRIERARNVYEAARFQSDNIHPASSKTNRERRIAYTAECKTELYRLLDML